MNREELERRRRILERLKNNDQIEKSDYEKKIEKLHEKEKEALKAEESTKNILSNMEADLLEQLIR